MKIRNILLCGVLALSTKADAQWVETNDTVKGLIENVAWMGNNALLVNAYPNDCILEQNGVWKFEYPFNYPTKYALDYNTFLLLGTNNRLSFMHRGGYSLGTVNPYLDEDTALKHQYAVQLHIMDSSHWFFLYCKADYSLLTRITTDRGQTWTTVPNFLPNEVFSMGFFHPFKYNFYSLDSCIWIYSGLIPDTLYRSRDFGMNWEKIVLPLWLKPAHMSSLAFSSKDVGLMTCYNDGGLARTTDGGLTWSTSGLKRPKGTNSRITYAKPSANKEGLFFIYGLHGCHYSSSEGLWWHELDDLQHEIMTFSDAENGYSFYPTWANQDWKYRYFQNDLNTHTGQIAAPLVSLYPNPASAMLRTSLEEPSLVVVYDLKGRKLLQSENFSANSPLDLQSLTAGYYLVYLPKYGQKQLIRVE